jgi:hypothetical protein
MKRIRILLFFMLIGNSAISQVNLDRLMIDRAPNCEDITYNCTRLIQKYFDTNKYDSSKIILSYWEAKCGTSEPLIRLKILFAIKDGTFTESLYDSTIIEYLKIYQNRFANTQSVESYTYYKYYYGYVPINGGFDRFTSILAHTLLIDQKPNTLEYAFCKGYAENPASLFLEIQNSEDLQSTNLGSYYYKIVNKYAKLPELGWSIFSGAWIPFGNTSTLGVHPLIGCDIGYKVDKMIYNFSMYIKFGTTPNKYVIIFEGNRDTTNYFLGGYIGFDVEREFFKVNNNEFHILAGVGWDGFDAVETNSSYYSSNYNKGKSINSLNINAGLGYMHYFKNSKFIEVRFKYNYVSYSNKGGTNLSGNTITTSLVFGGFTNFYKRNNLRAINYQDN